MSNNNKQAVLVLGATGNQGGAVVDAILNSPKLKNAVQIYALVRNPDKKEAQALQKRGVILVKGDLENKDSVQQALKNIDTVFSVQSNQNKGGVETEEKQGKLVAELAKDAKVKHFIYSSVEGAERNTGIPHFDNKWRIEQRIYELKLPYTIIRPVAFADMTVGGFGAFMLTALRTFLSPQTKLQVVAVADIGKAVALAIENRDKYIGKAIPLAGDELTREEMQKAQQKVLGTYHWAIPFVPSGVFRLAAGSDLTSMFQWFETHGYKTDIAATRKMLPSLQNYEQFLQGYKEKQQQKAE